MKSNDIDILTYLSQEFLYWLSFNPYFTGKIELI